MSERKMLERESKSTAAAPEIPFLKSVAASFLRATCRSRSAGDVQEETEIRIYEPAKKEKKVAEGAREENAGCLLVLLGKKSDELRERQSKTGKKKLGSGKKSLSLYSE